MLNFLWDWNFKGFLRSSLLSTCVGVLAGIAATLFLYTLDWATLTRLQNTQIIFLLPIAGFFIGWLYHRYGQSVLAGNNLILEEIHSPHKILPFRMAPLVFLGTILTHLFGGSAGREGTAVQMGASLSDQLGRLFNVNAQERKKFLMAGAGAGFAAAIGAPWAGAVFGMEVLYAKKLQTQAVLECIISAFVAYSVTLLLKAPHSVYPSVLIPNFSLSLLGYCVVLAIAFALIVKLFVVSTHSVEKLHVRFVSYPPLRPFIGGLLLVVLYYLEGTYRFSGLGIEQIQSSFLELSSLSDPVLKLIFTAITIGSAFKGGEFIPLVFMGCTLGSALTLYLPLATSFAASLGFAAVFAAASKTPVACTLMAVEIFGIGVAPYALVVCYVATYLAGSHGIYRAQK